MKKKLLTVLLAVVMVFGVFGLTACGGSNADADYNYYGVKYEIEDEVKIQAATFQGVYKMFTTAGSFVLYVNSGDKAEDFQKVNKLANDWNVTIYHFNPDLSGGYEKDNDSAVDANIIKKLSATAANSQLGLVQDTLSAISGLEATKWSDNSLYAISGAESTVSNGAVKYNGKIAKRTIGDKPTDTEPVIEPVADGAKVIAALATKNPSFGAYTEDERDVPVIPEAYNTSNINTMNLFGDSRLHMYGDTDNLTGEKEDVFVTVANYEMFAHLMDNNEGYFSVFFGGTWCGNTQAIVKATNELAKNYGIEKIYFFDPRLEDGTKIDTVSSSTTFSAEKLAEDELKAEKLSAELMSETDPEKIAELTAELKALYATAGYTTTYSVTENGAYLASSLNTRTEDGSKTAKWSSLNAYQQIMAAGKLATTTEKNEGFKDEAPEVIADEAYIEMIETAAEQEVIDDANGLAKYADYLTAVKADMKKSAFDELTAYELAEKIIAKYNADENTKAADKIDIIKVKATYVEDQLKAGIEAEYIDQTLAELKAAAEAAYNKANKTTYNYNFLYGKFLEKYLDTYASEWNIKNWSNNPDATERFIGITIDGDATATNFTRMCVPNIMMFNGDGEGKAKLVALAEAEYTFANVDEEGNAQQVAWTEAVKKVFDANPYATYTAPVAEAPAADASAGAAASTGSSSSAAASSDAC